MDISKYFLLNDGAPIRKLYDKMLRGSNIDSVKRIQKDTTIQNKDSADESSGDSNQEYEDKQFLREIIQETDYDPSYTNSGDSLPDLF